MTKKIRFIVLTVAVVMVSGQIMAQVTKLCSTPEANAEMLLRHPEIKDIAEELEIYSRDFSNYETRGTNETVLVIPVVFHVLHNYGYENISKVQIEDAIRVLNQDFRKLNWDTVNIVPAFKSIAADCYIEFRLAKIDPNGNCTDGIVRTATALTYAGDDDAKQVSPAWPRNKYLNIWTVSSLSSGAAGYSYYPSSVSGTWGQSVDGVMILHSYVGSIGSGSTLTSRTLTHEIGHYLNLMHPWGNTNDPGLTSNCGLSDQVADTPPTIGHTDCNLNANTCGQLDNVQNYMEYSYCYCMFTNGQKTRMRAALNSSVSGRNNLWTTANLDATGTSATSTPQICMPVADFDQSRSVGCTGDQIQFYDLTYNTDSISGYIWEFTGGTPSVSTDMNPLVSYATPGLYTVKMKVYNPTGSDSITKTNLIYITDPANGLAAPFSEGIENTSFPNNTSAPQQSWYTIKTGTYGWQRATTAHYTGLACLRVNNNSNAAGAISELYSPPIQLDPSGLSSQLTFQLAYALESTESAEKLQVFVSTNCGISWYPRYMRSGSGLATNGGNTASNFVPNANQWREESISLTPFLDNGWVQLKFVCTGDAGNSIYIDDINITILSSNDQPEAENNRISIFPNPISTESVIELNLEDQQEAKFILTDISGRELTIHKIEISGNSQIVELSQLIPANLAPGIYLAKITSGDFTQTIRLVNPGL